MSRGGTTVLATCLAVTLLGTTAFHGPSPSWPADLRGRMHVRAAVCLLVEPLDRHDADSPADHRRRDVESPHEVGPTKLRSYIAIARPASQPVVHAA